MANPLDLGFDPLQDAEKQPRLGLVQELMDTRKENSAVKSSNSQLKEELMKYKSVVQSLETQGFALQSHCTVADETKLVTSKVRLFEMSGQKHVSWDQCVRDSSCFGMCLDMRVAVRCQDVVTRAASCAGSAEPNPAAAVGEGREE